MDLEQELYAVGEGIKRDAPSWGVDLDNPAHEYTLWAPFPGRMAHCGSRRNLDAVYRLADQHIGLNKLYVATGPRKWLAVLKYERG